jgi:pyrroloquinoline quinone biosynthesis protein D
VLPLRCAQRGRAQTDGTMIDAGLFHVAKPALRAKARLRYDNLRRRFLLVLPEKAVLLNDTGAEILQLCDGSRTAAAVIDTLQRKYPETGVRPDVIEFLAEAVDRGWVEWIMPP